MPVAIVRGDGDSVDYIPSADVAAGDVIVQGDLIGVAAIAIPAGKLGALRVRGLFTMPKPSGTAISAGAILYWDATGNKVALTDGTGTNKKLGKAAAAAASADTTVLVLVTP